MPSKTEPGMNDLEEGSLIKLKFDKPGITLNET